MSSSIAIFGFGKMGQAIVSRWLKKKLELNIDIFDPLIATLTAQYIGESGFRLNPKISTAKGKKPKYDIIILAVKPQSLSQIQEPLLAILNDDTVLLSIMAGKSIDTLAEVSGAAKIVRAMPNTPAQIGEGVTAYIPNHAINSNDEALVRKLLMPLGPVFKLENEKQIDTVTAVSGSGPAYLFLLTEAIASAAFSEGLNQELAEDFARQTIIGAAALLKSSDQSPMELRKEVTSPGGTTEAALDVLTGGNAMGNLMKRAIEAAIKRSKDLGK